MNNQEANLCDWYKMSEQWQYYVNNHISRKFYSIDIKSVLINFTSKNINNKSTGAHCGWRDKSVYS